MSSADRDQIIRSIIKMEERINQCSRCESISPCTLRPSLGKGDLRPAVVMVFECENTFTADTQRIINLINEIKAGFNIEGVYYTFMVRCHPKACNNRLGNSYMLKGKMLDSNNNCRLSNRSCDGISIKPEDREIMNCLTFLVEEVEVLRPDYVILFGDQVSRYVLKAFGYHQSDWHDQSYKYDYRTFISTVEEKLFKRQHLDRILGYINQR